MNKIGCRVHLRAGPADRRQCRHPGHRGPLREGGRRPHLRHRRRGDERPDPPDALRRLPSHRPGERRRAAPRSSATSSGRSARPATSSPAAARCRGPKPAISSPSIPPAPTARCRPAPTIRGCSCRRCWSTATDFAVVRPRQTYEELIGLDRLPDWLSCETRSGRRRLRLRHSGNLCYVNRSRTMIEADAVEGQAQLDRQARPPRARDPPRPAGARLGAAVAAPRADPLGRSALRRPLLARLLAARRRLAAPRHARRARRWRCSGA